MKDLIKDKVSSVFDEVVAFRRELHENPELSYEEKETSQRILRELKKLPLDEIRENVGGYGMVGILKGKEEGRTLLLRGDIDALPIEEETGLEFTSKNKGVMHACGHDIHTSILLGACKILCDIKDKIKGNIVFCFQPAEEKPPHGGAQLMIDDGLLDDPKVEGALALHIWNFPVGKVAFRNGPMMAQSDRLFITIKGKSAHASQPESGLDAIVCASQVVNNLQTIVSRNVSPFNPLVITIGTIHGGNVYNVICDEVKLEGTVRVFDKKLADEIPDRLSNLIKPLAQSLGCEAEVELVRGYSITENNPEMFDIAKEALTRQLGPDNVIFPENPASGGEDFSAFGKYVPSMYIWLGMESDINKGKTTIHNPTLLVDEEAMKTGMETMVSFAFEFLDR